MHIVQGSDTRYWTSGQRICGSVVGEIWIGVRVSGRIYSVRTAVEMLAKGNSGEVICGEHLQSGGLWNICMDGCGTICLIFAKNQTNLRSKICVRRVSEGDFINYPHTFSVCG